MTRPYILHTFRMDEVQRRPQTVKVMRRRGPIPIFIEQLWMRARLPIPVTADTRHCRPHLGRFVIEKDKAHARRHHEPFLTACNHHIDAPGIHLKTITTKRGDTIGHQKRRVVSRIQHRAQCRDIVLNRGRRVDMHREDGFDLSLCICAQRLFNAVQIEGCLLAKVQHLDFSTEAFGNLAPADAKAACGEDQDPLSRCNGVAQARLPCGVTVADIHRHVMRGTGHTAQVRHDARHHINQSTCVDVGCTAVHRL